MTHQSRLAPVQEPAPLSHPEALLTDAGGQFARHYNRAPFLFAHGLAGHDLFALPQLRDLAGRLADHPETYWSNGRAQMQDRWEKGRDGRLSLHETIAHIASNDSLVILKHVEQDPAYAGLLRRFLSQVVAFSGDVMGADVIVGEVLVLVSSPNRLTPYHVDAETNFLVQITGDKTLCVYDHADRSLVSHAEREGYVAGDHNSARFRGERAGDGMVFDLRAGHGVHIPVFAPHWVQNGDNVSVSLSVNYELRSVKQMSEVYLINRYLRRLGMAPTPPGRSVTKDAAKRMIAKGLRRLR